MCRQYDHLYKKIKNKKETKEYRRNLDLGSEFRKVSGYEIDTQKSTLFLYASNEQSELKLQNSKTQAPQSLGLLC